jgi:uncharacterized repeat protein (TIGR04076 family)
MTETISLAEQEKLVADVKAEVVTVRGTCNAELKEGDTFLIRGLNIVPQGNDKACSVAFASIMMNVGRLRLQDGPVHVSCPDAGMGEGGNVLFKLSLVKGHEDDQH